MNSKTRNRYERKKEYDEFDREMARYMEELLETLKRREEEAARNRPDGEFI